TPLAALRASQAAKASSSPASSRQYTSDGGRGPGNRVSVGYRYGSIQADAGSPATTTTRTATGPRRRRTFADYLCRHWNRSHGDDLCSPTLYYVEQPTRLSGPEPTRRVELGGDGCR
ncbi:hypothetical protein ACFQE1_16950, partial [Halobium palmae]